MRWNIRFGNGMMRPKYRQPKELKFSPRFFFLTPLMGGRARISYMLSSPQWIAYLLTRFLPPVSSGTQCNRNTYSYTTDVARTSHTTIHPKVKEFWEIAKEETVVDFKKLVAGSP